MSSRRRLTCSSVRSRTRVSPLSFVWLTILLAVGWSMRKRWVSATASRFSRRMSSVAMRASVLLSLSLFVLGIGADDHHRAVAADDFAVVAARLDGGSDFQRILE